MILNIMNEVFVCSGEGYFGVDLLNNNILEN